MSWSNAGLRAIDRPRDLIQVPGLERQVAGREPSVDLLWGPGADDRAAHARPAQGPGDRDRRERKPMSRGDRPKCVASPQVAAEQRLPELGVASAPVIAIHPVNARAAEAVGE